MGRFTETVVVVAVDAGDGTGGGDCSCQVVWLAGLGLLVQLLEEGAERALLLLLGTWWLGCDGRV